jgi:enamine deaminase RidA (YjgF/YER057c/UK114 family)
MILAQAIETLCIRFGRSDTQVSTGESGLVLDLGVPVLAGPAQERHPAGEGARVENLSGMHMLRSPSKLVGAIVHPATPDSLESAARAVYDRLLASLGGFRLYRVWNYVPRINEVNGGLENYHRFNIGRWQAFDKFFGPELDQFMPAASAVGIEDPLLVTIFTAGHGPVEYVENPQQTPAWRYPERYGPKSPSFSRGARHDTPAGPQVFLSGTASIRGHQTVGVGDMAAQCRLTCENIRLVFQQMGLPDPFAAAAFPYQTKVYLRHPGDLPRVKELLAQDACPALVETATFLHADICRPDLDLEIEMTLC